MSNPRTRKPAAAAAGDAADTIDAAHNAELTAATARISELEDSLQQLGQHAEQLQAQLADATRLTDELTTAHHTELTELRTETDATIAELEAKLAELENAAPGEMLNITPRDAGAIATEDGPMLAPDGFERWVAKGDRIPAGYTPLP